jgi:NADH:ubiquinone reductase (H+-translocating)
LSQLAAPLQPVQGRRPQVVIVGGGFAGIHAAKGLGRLEVDVTVIDRRNHHTFQPLLYQVALAVLSPADIASPIRSILRHSANTQVLMDEVVGIDSQSQKLSLKSGAVVPYDYLVLAAGATHSYFGHNEWAPSAPGLKTLEDATEIRRRILLAFELAERQKQESSAADLPESNWQALSATSRSIICATTFAISAPIKQKCCSSMAATDCSQPTRRI